MENICILTTGGTLDKEHDPITEKLVFSNRSYVPDIIRQCRGPELKHEVLMIKDSNDITNEDRQAIVDAVLRRSESKIIITHGTDTMTVTAEALLGKAPEKTIVLTGALRPYSLGRSDAGFNLGTAIATAQILKHGVYVTMNGEVFVAGKVRKNKETGFFEAV